MRRRPHRRARAIGEGGRPAWTTSSRSRIASSGELSQGFDVSLRPADVEAIAARETELARGLGGLLAWHAAPPSRHARVDGARRRALRAGARPRPGVRRRMGAPRHHVHAAGARSSAEPPLLDQAVDAFTRALVLDADNIYALTGMGSVYVGLGRVDEAITLLTRAIELEPTNVMARMTLARAFWIGKGHFDEAIAVLRRALAHNTDAGYVHQQLALLLTLRGDLSGRAAEAQSLRGPPGVAEVGRPTACSWSAATCASATSVIGRAITPTRWRSISASVPFSTRTITRSPSVSPSRSHRNSAPPGGVVRITRRPTRRSRKPCRASRLGALTGRDDGFTKYYIASMYALRGAEEEAVRLLGEAITTHPALNRARARIDPDFDPIRQSPAFKALGDESSQRRDLGLRKTTPGFTCADNGPARGRGLQPGRCGLRRDLRPDATAQGGQLRGQGGRTRMRNELRR